MTSSHSFMSLNPELFALDCIREMQAYVPGQQPQESGWLKLNTNEFPFPPSPEVSKAIISELDRMPLYPDPPALKLRETIASLHGLTAARIVAGNGSDDVINLLIRTFSGGGRTVGMLDPSYSLYPVLAKIQNARMIQLPLAATIELPIDAIAQSGVNLFFLTSPHAPTGTAFSNAQIESILKSFTGILVVDEAYGDFAEESAIKLISKYSNLVVTRTLSKSYGLAGLRVGYMIADPSVVDLIDRVRDSYNVNRLSQAGAIAALKDQSYYRERLALLKLQRTRLIEQFRRWGWFTYDSQANFIFSRPTRLSGAWGPAQGKSAYEWLLQNKILVRHFTSSPLTDAFLRISMGTEQQIDKLINTLDQWRQQE
jgi:histidinol-phosphate aminotransferase